MRFPAALASGSGQTVPIQRSFMVFGIAFVVGGRKIEVVSDCWVRSYLWQPLQSFFQVEGHIRNLLVSEVHQPH